MDMDWPPKFFWWFLNMCAILKSKLEVMWRLEKCLSNLQKSNHSSMHYSGTQKVHTFASFAWWKRYTIIWFVCFGWYAPHLQINSKVNIFFCHVSINYRMWYFFPFFFHIYLRENCLQFALHIYFFSPSSHKLWICCSFCREKKIIVHINFIASIKLLFILFNWIRKMLWNILFQYYSKWWPLVKKNFIHLNNLLVFFWYYPVYRKKKISVCEYNEPRSNVCFKMMKISNIV